MAEFEVNLVKRIFKISTDRGVCARCGREAISKKGELKGKLYSQDSVLFYECNVCVNIENDKFFFNKWYDMYLTR